MWWRKHGVIAPGAFPKLVGDVKIFVRNTVALIVFDLRLQREVPGG